MFIFRQTNIRLISTKLPFNSQIRSLWIASIFALIWEIWSSRNKQIFEGKRANIWFSKLWILWLVQGVPMQNTLKQNSIINSKKDNIQTEDKKNLKNSIWSTHYCASLKFFCKKIQTKEKECMTQDPQLEIKFVKRKVQVVFISSWC